MTTDSSSPATTTPFTETRRFKVMRTLIGASRPLVTAMLSRGSGGPMGRQLTLLRFRGRTSGRWYQTPVGYVRDGDTVVIVTSPAYSWWRNVREGAEVDVRLDGGWRTGHARIVGPDDPAYDETIALQVSKRGAGMLRGFGVDVDDAGRVADGAREAAGRAAHLVRVELAGPAPDRR